MGRVYVALVRGKHILSLEGRCFVDHVLSVYRMRPMDEDDKANSDNLYEDDELFLSPEDVKNALETKIGGMRSEHKLDLMPNANGA